MKFSFSKIIPFCVFVVFFLFSSERPVFSGPASTDLLMKSLEIKDISFCDEEVPLNREDIRERFEKEMLLILWDKPQVILWFKRATRFFPVIEKALKDAKMPDDLKYIVVIESAMRPHIGSRKGARGFWQFIASTAKHYGLKIDDEVDERRDIILSTEAAIKYLKKLHGDFNSWTLSAAAYNMGEKGLEFEMKDQDEIDFYNLHLPLETQRYVLRIVAAKYIMKDPKKYGFNIKESGFYKPFEFDEVTIKCKSRIPLRIVARAAGTYFKKILDLNPKFRTRYLKGTINIRIPKGSKDFDEKFKALSGEYLKKRADQFYVVKSGDNLTTIAEQFNVSVSSLIQWNRIAKRDRIYPGKKLVIYKNKNGDN